jgi:hypothetical protein
MGAIITGYSMPSIWVKSVSIFCMALFSGRKNREKQVNISVWLQIQVAAGYHH